MLHLSSHMIDTARECFRSHLHQALNKARRRNRQGGVALHRSTVNSVVALDRSATPLWTDQRSVDRGVALDRWTGVRVIGGLAWASRCSFSHRGVALH